MFRLQSNNVRYCFDFLSKFDLIQGKKFDFDEKMEIKFFEFYFMFLSIDLV